MIPLRVEQNWKFEIMTQSFTLDIFFKVTDQKFYTVSLKKPQESTLMQIQKNSPYLLKYFTLGSPSTFVSEKNFTS